MVKLCRLCLKPIDGSNYVLIKNEKNHSEDIITKLQTCIPELALNAVKESVTCYTCSERLDQFYLFKCSCMESDNIIRNYIRKFHINTGLTELNDNQLTKSAIEEVIETNTTLFLHRKENEVYTSFPLNNELIKEHQQEINFNNDKFEILLSEKVAKMKHNKSCHSKTLKCCHSSSEVASDFRSSAQIHANKPIFQCEYCNRQFSRRTRLKTHVRVHTGEKPFQCEYCDYKSARKIGLKEHLQKHSGEKRFHCEYCDYKCIRKSHLQLHERIHTGEKPFHCNLCNYKCTQETTLKEHLQNHVGVKQFQCEYCGYKCAKKATLTSHIRVHTGEKPYECKDCDYKCSQKINLLTHSRKHSGEKPFQCEYCGYKCSQKSNLTIHLKIHNRISV